MSVEQLLALAKVRFRRVTVVSPGRFAHSKLNVQERNAPVSWDAEVLITCYP
jgi:hypothetical protein